MTPEEKAKELVDKFDQHVVSTNYRHMSEYSVKDCAIIAVDEILQIVPSVYLTEDAEIHTGHYQYWAEVKSELEKL